MILVLSCLFHCLGLTFSLFLFCLAFSIIISWVMWVFFSHAVLILMSWEKIYKQISINAYLIYLFIFIVRVEFHMKSKHIFHNILMNICSCNFQSQSILINVPKREVNIHSQNCFKVHVSTNIWSFLFKNSFC